MRKGWTTTKLIAAGSVGVAMLIFSLVGGVLNAATGISGIGGLINVFVQGGLTTFVVLTVRQFGAATITWLVFGILTIPLPIMGPAGFFLKIFNGLFIGICSDTAYLFLKKRDKLAAILVGAVSIVSAGIPLLIIMGFLGIKWLAIAEQLSEMLVTFPGALFLLFLSSFMGMFAGFLGWVAYDKLKDTTTVKRIQQ